MQHHTIVLIMIMIIIIITTTIMIRNTINDYDNHVYHNDENSDGYDDIDYDYDGDDYDYNYDENDFLLLDFGFYSHFNPLGNKLANLTILPLGWLRPSKRLPAPSALSLASNRQPSYLNQWYGENGCKTVLHHQIPVNPGFSLT